MSADDKPLDVQIGGDHYKSMAIQPMEYSMANKLDACQHTIIKYVTRFREKGGIQDLEKAKHCIDLLIHFERQAATVKESLTVHQAGVLTYNFDKMTPPPSFGQQNMIDPADVEIASAIGDDSLSMQIIGQSGEMASEVYAAVDQNAWANCELESLTSESRKDAKEDENGVFWSERGRAFNMNRWRVRRWFK